MSSEPKVYKLDPQAEIDMKRKSGDIELVVVFKKGEGYDAYLPSDIPHLIRPNGDGTISLHSGTNRTGEAKAEFDHLANEIDCSKQDLDYNGFENVGLLEDVGLTKVEYRKAGDVRFEDITKAVETITYARLSKFRCCIPSVTPPFYCP